MKFTTIASAIAVALLCSVVAEAYRDKKCYDKEMRLSKFESIKCDDFIIKNTCDHDAEILQPTAGDWIRDLHNGASQKIGCFEVVGRLEDLECYRFTMRNEPAKNIICGQFNIRNTCSTVEQISQPAASNWVRDLREGKGPTTVGCFKATELK
ncbi:MAG: hypothetical protein J3Q66DRAFT_398915 [Benniella sp.]|nr:MAG: hypothetical protein J3Q66DRAFT_398915 [Benniella sp.]